MTKFYGTFKVVTLIGVFLINVFLTTAHSEDTLPLLTTEEKTLALESYREAINEWNAGIERYRYGLDYSMTNYTYEPSGPTGSKDSPHQVRITYKKDKEKDDIDLPVLVKGVPHFSENKTEEFYEAKCEEILSYYLGNDHASYDAQLTTTNGHYLTIKVFAQNADVLEPLLSDERIVYIRHYGDGVYQHWGR